MKTTVVEQVLPWIAGVLGFVLLLFGLSVAGFFGVVVLWFVGWTLFIIHCVTRPMRPGLSSHDK